LPIWYSIVRIKKKGGEKMKRKYEIQIKKDNILISREFPEIKRTIRRVVLNTSGWESLVRWAKRDILKESKEVWLFKERR
jgi:hypothetical protein